MELEKLSATSADTYEKCPARWQAMYVGERPDEVSGAPAMKGTVCHHALEQWVKADGHRHVDRARSYEMLVSAAKAKYDELFADTSEWSDCFEMLRAWFNNTGSDYWEGRAVLSTEFRDEFGIPTSDGMKPFVFVCDRVDLVRGRLEIIDYKTYRQPSKADQMRHNLQVRAYAVAAFIKYKDRYDFDTVTVTLDLLRYDRVSVTFTRSECIDTWHYLVKLAERILHDEDPKETINEDCRYCIRRHACRALKSHASAFGPLGITDPDQAAEMLHELRGALKAMQANETDLKDLILRYCREEDLTGFQTDDGVVVKLSSKKVGGMYTAPMITTKKVA